MTRAVDRLGRAEALALLESGAWQTDLQIQDDIWERAGRRRAALGSWAEQGLRQALASSGGTGRGDQFGSSLQDMRRATDALLAERVESRLLEPPVYGPMAQLRVDAHVVYKVRATAEAGLRDALALILVLLTTSGYPRLLAAWAGLSLVALVRILVNGLERITDPAERLVLEAVHEASAELCVRNHDALATEDFEAAFGRVAPSEARLVALLEGRLPPEECRRALQALAGRGVLVERQGGWRIAF
ncbi:hypothetical protein HB662_01045 [Roseomonas frigidaquae]|uniref:Uncharacterized protein n=1 Tax=Falsiroseomonas frigidaquae TaxID=487318 RepID=A0ABX1ERU3_9PROT|nr:hypothetical protein [Falsiroseomonas frigidaquae]NKE43345.1 hypothetical protein [Falsiroseomonas frigidaquae]